MIEFERLLADADEIAAILMANLAAKAEREGRAAGHDDAGTVIQALLSACYVVARDTVEGDADAGLRCYAGLLRRHAENVERHAGEPDGPAG